MLILYDENEHGHVENLDTNKSHNATEIYS